MESRGLAIRRSNAANNHHGFRPFWYGQWRDERTGKPGYHKLPVRIKGVPPESGCLFDAGDDAFERSRQKAQAVFDEIRKRRTDKAANVHTLKAIYKEQSGREYEDTDLRLDELAKRVTGRHGAAHSANNRAWLNFIESIFDAFAKFAAKHDRATMLAVDTDLAKEYANHLAKTYAWETVKKHIHRLSTAFARYLPGGFSNPFAGILKETKDDNHGISTRSISRRPLTDAELDALYREAWKMGGTVYGMTVCAANTGLRIKDVCNLTWADVDLRQGLIDCVTAKTGAQVTIPILDGLRDVLDGANTDAAGKDPVYVFPEAHAQYAANPSGVIRRGKTLFARALFGSAEDEPTDANAPEITPEEKHARIMDAINGAGWTDAKRARILANYTIFHNGGTYGDIQRQTGWPKNRTSMDFAEVERLAGVRFRPAPSGKATTRDLLDKTRETRTHGKRAGSLYGWHSLRHTFVMRALDAGVLITDIQLIVGHTTVEQTMEYCNSTKKLAAERMRKRMDRKRAAAQAGNLAAVGVNPAMAQALKALLAAMPKEQQAALLQNQLNQTMKALN